MAALLVAALCATALTSHADDWRPAGLVVLLSAVALLSELVVVETRTMRLSGSFVALVLAMVLLGPAPAVAMAVMGILIEGLVRRLPWPGLVANLACYATFPLIGGLAARWLGIDALEPVAFALAVGGVAAVTNVLNFLLIAVPRSFTRGEPLLQQVRQVYIPVLPSELVTLAAAAAAAAVYRELGLPSLLALVIVLALFQVLTRELVRSQQRAEQLEQRTKELGALQVGVLAGFVQTLALRDKMTARHSAAVARYARAIAAEVGRSAAEQDLVHTAGLLHDLGKFAFPDAILLGKERLTEEQYALVKRHPEHGARLLRRVDGYGPVADIVLAHHERLDGRGYPKGLSGDEVPLLSRMISIADTYDVMTARDSYREPVSRDDAIAELRRVSGSQLDGELVEAFVRVLARRGLAFQHTTDADFEAELRFDRRVRDFALPAAA
jgi:putative nucleotidyltransferase with HDIG domain